MAGEMALDLPAVTRLQQLKTGALIGWCVEAGAIMGRAPAEGGPACAAMPATSASPSRSPTICSTMQGCEEKAGKRVGKDEAAGKADLRLAARPGAGAAAGATAGRAGDRSSARLRRGCRSARARRALRGRAGSLNRLGVARPEEGHEDRRLSRHVRSDHARPYGHHPRAAPIWSTGWSSASPPIPPSRRCSRSRSGSAMVAARDGAPIGARHQRRRLRFAADGLRRSARAPR